MLFHFQNFSLSHGKSTLKIGTDAVLLAAMVPLESPACVLDIGTGCGVVAFCLADRLCAKGTPPLQIVGIDIDLPSIEEARQNLLRFLPNHPLDISFQQQSFQQIVEDPIAPFDLIVSNPPFFGSSLKPEDPLRLRGKHRDGNLPFRDLVDGVSRKLTSDGTFFLILPPAEFLEFASCAEGKLFVHYHARIFPKTGKTCHRIIAGYKKAPASLIDRQTLVIRDVDGNYTDAYRQYTGNLYWQITGKKPSIPPLDPPQK